MGKLLDNWHVIKKSQPILKGFFWIIPLILGFGAYPLIVPMAVGLLYYSKKSFFKNILNTLLTPGFLSLFTITVFFLSFYWGLYIPYHPNILRMPFGYFPILSTISIVSLLWFSCLGKNNSPIKFIWLFCFGSLFFSLLTIITTVILLNPPYHANAIDIRYAAFGYIKHLNTPGISSLLTLFPLAFIAGVILNSDQRPKHYWLLGITGFAFSLAAATVISQRSFYVIVLFIEPIIVGFFLLLTRSWHRFFAVISLIAIYPILWLLDQLPRLAFLNRPLDRSLVSDARFQMFQFWLERVIKNPFDVIEVGPAQWSSLQWFHNFFADVHRLSGFWTLLIAIILMAYIFYRIICVIRIDQRVGLFLMAVAIPCFLIMNTSVVPEGEVQPFLLMLAIGAISEALISRAKGGHKLNCTNPL